MAKPGALDRAAVLQDPWHLPAGEGPIPYHGDEIFQPAGGHRGSLAADDPMPPGPFRISLLWDIDLQDYVRPYLLLAGDGIVVAGWINSFAAAVTLRDALNGVNGIAAGLPQLPKVAAEPPPDAVWHRRRGTLITFDGVTLDVSGWSLRTNIPETTLRYRIRAMLTAAEVLAPVRPSPEDQANPEDWGISGDKD